MLNEEKSDSEASSGSIDLSILDQKKMSLTHEQDVLELKYKLEGWKLILLPINNLLEWEHKYAPFLIIFFDTFLFGLLWYYNPSILTTVSMLGLAMLLIESVVPLVAGYFFKSAEWEPASESKYTRICERIANFQTHVRNSKVKLESIRKEKQPLYFLIVFFFLIFCAYVGQSVDNLLLTFLAVLVLTLTPGARRHRIMQKLWAKVKKTIGVGSSNVKLTVSAKKDNNAFSSPEITSTSSSFESNKTK